MRYLRIVLWIIAISQLALGALTLVAPGFFFAAMGLASPPPDTFYLIGMLASRFLVFGAVLVVLARRDAVEPLWLQAALGMQVIDLACGLFYTGSGVLPWTVSAFPMFNAALFSVLLLVAMRRDGWRAVPAA
jgi:hypothetical protein